MVVPSLQPGDPSADGSRWALMRTSMAEAWVERVWLIWVWTAGVSACLSAVVIALILRRGRLRRKQFNLFIVGLAIPDVVFSGLCAITCLLNYLHRQYYGGDLMCNFQSLYCTFGFAGSIWMNVLISRELARMAECPTRLICYRPLEPRVCVRNIASVHLAALVFSALTYVPFLPAQAGLQRGLACLPMEYDITSAMFQWAFTMQLMLVWPLLAILYYFKRIIVCMLGVENVDQSDVEIVKFFVRLFVVFLGTWLPTGIFIWILVYPGRVMEHSQWVGGTISHLQGIVSAILYLRKRDLRMELRMRCGLGTTAEQPRKLAREGGGSFAFDFPGPGELSALSNSSTRSLANVAPLESAAWLNTTSMEREMTSLQAEMRDMLQAKELEPMLVVEYAAWLSLGSFPRSSDGSTRRVRDTDTVVFVSHRWWTPECPDDGRGTKYDLLCKGLMALIRRHQLSPVDLVIWVDWASIDQDDLGAQSRGIASLVAYAARSSFVLIPVRPDDGRSLRRASHPGQLESYGERAWCRLEIYIFSCVSEVLQRFPACYAFGVVRTACGLQRELLKSFTSGASSSGVVFDLSEMPSTGMLSVEADRDTIRQAEEDTRTIYARHAILRQRLKMVCDTRLRECMLDKKQIGCPEMALLAACLNEPAIASRLRLLKLDGNLLGAEGMEMLADHLVCVSPGLRKLSLCNNPRLDVEAMEHLAGALGDPACPLETLQLSRCGLGSGEVSPLIDSLPAATLKLLDVSFNRLTDEVVRDLLDGAGGTDHPRLALDVEGNPISVPLFRLVNRASATLAMGTRSVVMKQEMTTRTTGSRTSLARGGRRRQVDASLSSAASSRSSKAANSRSVSILDDFEENGNEVDWDVDKVLPERSRQVTFLPQLVEDELSSVQDARSVGHQASSSSGLVRDEAGEVVVSIDIGLPSQPSKACAVGCGRLACFGFRPCCRTCEQTAGARHGLRCQRRWEDKEELADSERGEGEAEIEDVIKKEVPDERGLAVGSAPSGGEVDYDLDKALVGVYKWTDHLDDPETDHHIEGVFMSGVRMQCSEPPMMMMKVLS